MAKNIYKYDFRFIDNLTETKDLQKAIKINLIIMICFAIAFIGALVIGIVFLSQAKITFLFLMGFCGLMQILTYIFCIRAIIRAKKKIKNNKSEL